MLTQTFENIAFKRSGLALRTGSKYGDPRRLVWELRAVSYSLEQARSILIQQARFLENPEGSRVGFGLMARKVPIDELLSIDRFGPNRLEPLRERFDRDRMRYLDAMYPKLLHHAASPFDPWERRPGIPVPLQRQIVKARDEYRKRIAELPKITEWHQVPAAMNEITEGVHDFAVSTQLHDYL